jgi:N6-adenosine-specific RNA methylase IME4
MSWPFGDLRMFGYDVVIADPPWAFELRSEKGNLKAASHHYETMPLEEIKALPVANLVRHDALLLLWTTGWAIARGDAQMVARAWHAEPVTELVWLKTTRHGLRRTGPGYRARTRHEPVLLCKWGNPKHKPFPSDFPGIARRHSEKPDEFYRMVADHTPGAWRCDLFSAGIIRPGFVGWGQDHRTTSPNADQPKEPQCPSLI